MADEEEIIDNALRLIGAAIQQPAEDLDMEAALADLGFDKKSLQELAYVINKDDYFKPLGVGLIPGDVADCVTVDDVVELVQNELNYEAPVRRKRDKDKPRGR